MRRVVSLFLPFLPTDLLRRRGGLTAGPLVTSQHDGRKLVIEAADAAAVWLGLRPGLPIGQAQARVPGLVVVPGRPEQDAATLRRIARLCLRYAPLTAPAPPDGVWIDATGSAHLFGGERRMLASMVARFAADGIEARAAIAGTPGAAHATARFGTLDDGIVVVSPGDERATLTGMPIEALRLEAELCVQLRLVGLDTVGALLAMPRGPLARRFGGAGLRLDQALGVVDEPIRPEPPTRPIASRLGFVEPLLTADAFAAVIARLVDDVCTRLDTAGLGVRRLELGFERVDGTVQMVRVSTARPVRDRRRLEQLLEERLETVDPGLGVEAMRLSVRSAERLELRQSDARFGGGGRGFGEGVAPLVDTLTNRLGAGRVWRPVLVQSDVPERSMARVAPLDSPTDAEWPDHLPRPVRLLDPPQPVEVMALLPDHPPASFTWRQIRHRVRHADGPERIAGEWWRRSGEVSALRDYFRIEDMDGRRFWLFRRGDGADPATGDMRWFLHGLF